VSYWRFEGNSNDSKSSNNGIDTNITYGTSYGKFGQGASFNGTTSQIVLGTWFNFQQFTISLWVNPDSTQNQYADIFDNNHTGTQNLNCQQDNTNTNVYTMGGTDGTRWSITPFTLTSGILTHLAFTFDGSRMRGYINGMLLGIGDPINGIYYNNQSFILGNWGLDGRHWKGYMDDVAIFSRALSSSEVYNLYNSDKSYYHQGRTSDYGSLPCGDDNSISLNTWSRFKILLKRSVEAGKLSTTDVVSTYSLVYTTNRAYVGGVLAPNGDVHFIPCLATVGQKISAAGIVSTYSLVYTNNNDAYYGGVLAPNGDIHFVPVGAEVGQKVSIDGTVSTYPLVYTASYAYAGGVLAPNGDIHFVPYGAEVGQKISIDGTVSTYPLVYTASYAYFGGVLAPNGDIHFLPRQSTVGQKISFDGYVSTYSLVVTGTDYFYCGCLDSEGSIHFIPARSPVGQKVSISGTVSTYSLIYTVNYAYIGGVLAPNGDVHFIPCFATVGQKISSVGVVSTYSLIQTNQSIGGVLASNGDIYYTPHSATVGQKISTQSTLPFSLGTCCSPFFNKF